MSQTLTSYLNQALIRLEKLAEKKSSEQSSSKALIAELQRIRMLEDLIKEQTPDENTRTAASKTR